MSRRTYQVKEVAELAEVSVRTLHHYDEIGLLTPRRRTEAGYRLYDDDLLRLQQILIGRALGLPLEAIRRSLDDPSFDREQALLAQKSEGESMDMKQIFDGFDPAQYEHEAEQHWGDTDAYKESVERTRRYTEDDWKRFAFEQSSVYADLAAAMSAGKKPSDADVLHAAERHRLLIDRWFYPCSRAMHVGLAGPVRERCAIFRQHRQVW